MWRTAVQQLLDHSDVTALRLKPVEVDAYTGLLVESKEPRPRLDLAEPARRMAALRKDQDATYDRSRCGPVCSDSTNSWELLRHQSVRE